MADTIHCSFCGNSQYDVHRFIAGPRVFVCDACVMLMAAILEREDRKGHDQPADDAFDAPARGRPAGPL